VASENFSWFLNRGSTGHFSPKNAFSRSLSISAKILKEIVPECGQIEEMGERCNFGEKLNFFVPECGQID
jgi:hypothetical protein